MTDLLTKSNNFLASIANRKESVAIIAGSLSLPSELNTIAAISQWHGYVLTNNAVTLEQPGGPNRALQCVPPISSISTVNTYSI